MTRLIKPDDIPESLWLAKSKCIQLAPDLVEAWKQLLRHSGLYEKAQQKVPKNIVGGFSKEATDEHLAWRFSGSSARVQLGLLDPHNELNGATDAFARIFSGGTILVADLPCGSGAAVLTLLATVAELRRQGRVPREPLHVKVIGGELSKFARDYASLAMNHLKTSLSEQAIWVTAEFISWDALDKFSTADLTNLLTLRGQGCSARLMILANFSGFLQGHGKWKEATPQFASLFIHGRANESYVIWIEPQENSVLSEGGFFERVLEWFKKLFASHQTPEEQTLLHVDNLGKSHAEVQHPLRDEHHFKVNLVIQRFDLPVTGAKA